MHEHQLKQLLDGQVIEVTKELANKLAAKLGGVMILGELPDDRVRIGRDPMLQQHQLAAGRGPLDPTQRERELVAKLDAERAGAYNYAAPPGFWPSTEEQAHRGITLTALNLLRAFVDDPDKVDEERVERWLNHLEGMELWPQTPGELLVQRHLQQGIGISVAAPPHTYDYQVLSADVVRSCLVDERPDVVGNLADYMHQITPSDSPLLRQLSRDIQDRVLSPAFQGLPSGPAEALWGRLQNVCPKAIRIGDRALVVIQAAFTHDIAIVDLCAPETEGMRFHGRWGYVDQNRACEAFELWQHNEFRGPPPNPSVVHQDVK